MRCLILGLALTVACTVAVTADTWLVRPDGSGDYPTIQAAINEAEVGDVIELASGIFSGAGNRDIDLVGKDLTVRSQSGDPAACIIDCEGSSADPHRGFYVHLGESAAALIEDIQVVGGFAPALPDRWGGGILCKDASPTIRNVICRDNAAGWGGGMLFWNSASQVSGCLATGNWSDQNGGGIYCTTGSAPALQNCTLLWNWTGGNGGGLAINACAPLVENCTLCGNAAQEGGGVWSLNGAFPEFENTIIAFSTEGQAFACEGGGMPELSCCDIYGNDGGDWTGTIAPQFGMQGNLCLDPLFCDRDAGNLMLECFSPCAPFTPPNAQCDLIGAWPVGCGASPVVAQTWGGIKSLFMR